MLNNGKARIDDANNRLSITVPSKKNWFGLIFATGWMGAWFCGFIFAFTTLFFGPHGAFDAFLGFWLIAWTAGGVMISYFLLWGYTGKEIITMDRNEVTFGKSILSYYKPKHLELNEVKNFRVSPISTSLFGGNRMAFWGIGGKIQFDYGFKTFSFGLAVDDAEANYLVELLNNRVKSYTSTLV